MLLFIINPSSYVWIILSDSPVLLFIFLPHYQASLLLSQSSLASTAPTSSRSPSRWDAATSGPWTTLVNQTQMWNGSSRTVLCPAQTASTLRTLTTTLSSQSPMPRGRMLASTPWRFKTAMALTVRLLSWLCWVSWKTTHKGCGCESSWWLWQEILIQCTGFLVTEWSKHSYTSFFIYFPLEASVNIIQEF